MMARLAATGIELALRFARLVPFSTSSIDSASGLRLLAESVRSSILDEFESRGNPVRRETENTLEHAHWTHCRSPSGSIQEPICSCRRRVAVPRQQRISHARARFRRSGTDSRLRWPDVTVLSSIAMRPCLGARSDHVSRMVLFWTTQIGYWRCKIIMKLIKLLKDRPLLCQIRRIGSHLSRCVRCGR